MGTDFDVNALTVTVGGLTSFGVVQATRVMVDWLRELVEPKSPYTIRWIVTILSLINVILFMLSFTNPRVEIGDTVVAVGEVAAWILAVFYITTLVAWTVNSFHVKEVASKLR